MMSMAEPIQKCFLQEAFLSQGLKAVDRQGLEQRKGKALRVEGWPHRRWRVRSR